MYNCKTLACCSCEKNYRYITIHVEFPQKVNIIELGVKLDKQK